MGFVSNSSSTSFCVYGARFNRNDENDVEDKLEKSDLKVFYGEYEDIYVGKEWYKIGDNETGAEFKARIETTIRELFGSDTTCDTYEEGFYNG
jgi:hypothetical protein